jgi:hypothetical protein
MPQDGRLAYDRSGSDDKTLMILDDYQHQAHWGHLDLILGRHARQHVWQTIHDWMHPRAQDHPAPTPLCDADHASFPTPSPRPRRRDTLRGHTPSSW